MSTYINPQFDEILRRIAMIRSGTAVDAVQLVEILDLLHDLVVEIRKIPVVHSGLTL